MKRLSLWLATLVIASAATGLILALAAAFDQFARLPFYHTLLAVAAAADIGALLVTWRTWGRRGSVPADIRAGASALRPAWLGWAARRFLRAPRQASPKHAPAASRGRQPSPREIGESLRKVHSVAWGFPSRRRTA